MTRSTRCLACLSRTLLSAACVLSWLTWPDTLAFANDAPHRAVPDFELRDWRGKSFRLSECDSRVLVVVFVGTECPLARLYAPRLQELANRFADQDVAFVAIDSNRQDSLTEIGAFAREYGLQIPLLKDPGNRVADLFRAERTPEAFVLNAARQVVFRGRIDDQYGVGYARAKAVEQYLAEAIVQQLAGRTPTPSDVAAIGCVIGRVRPPQPDARITWSDHIAPILSRHCVECHQPGEIAPFSLLDYEDVSGWGPTIAEVVEQHRMPPWHADAEPGHFQNERRLSDVERHELLEWVAAGCPAGDRTVTPDLPERSGEWQLPARPDVVLPMRERPFDVPAEGTVEYRYFVVDPGFETDRWVRAAEIRPGNRAVVHHAIVFVRPPDGRRSRGIGWLAAYVPGQRIEQLEPGLARRIPAGSRLVFQMHYTPTGSAQQDLTQLGLVFAEDGDVREEVVTLLALNQEFEIPPHAAPHEVRTRLTRFPENGRLLAIVPHMHLRGDSCRVLLQQGTAKPRVLLDVPHYDFNWQTTYVLSQPVTLKPGDRLDSVLHFDNSEANLNNPDPSATVRWGDQTWEEMALTYFAVAVPVGQAGSGSRRESTLSAEDRDWIASRTARLLKELDADGNGQVTADEVTETFLQFAFDQYDTDGDLVLTRDEIRAGVEKARRRRGRRR